MGERFVFHVAPVVTLADGKQYVFDPLFKGGPLLLADWVVKQKPENETATITPDSPTFSKIPSTSGGMTFAVWYNVPLQWSSSKDLAEKFLKAYDKLKNPEE